MPAAALNQSMQKLARDSVGALTPLVMQRIYESGAWTPRLAGVTTPGVLSYNVVTTVGRFVRVGATVTATATILLTGITTAAVGDLILTGLPFTAAATGIRAGGVTIYDNYNMSAGSLELKVYPEAGQSYATFAETVDNAARVTAVAGNLTTTTRLEIWLTYEAVEAGERLSVPEAILALGPIAYWQLNETSGTTAADSSGNGRTGTYSGVTVGGDFPPFTAPIFDGSTSYVNVYSASLAGAFTSGLGTILAFVQPAGTAAADRTAVHLGSSAFNEFARLYWRDSTLLGARSDTSGSQISNAGAASPSTWAMLATTFSVAGNAVITYYNGVAVGTLTGPAAWGAGLNSANAAIGRFSLFSLFYWQGQIAHVAVFASVLSAADILSVYDAYQSQL